MDRHHPDAVAVFLEERCLGSLRVFRGGTQLVGKSSKRDTAIALVLSRELGDVENVGERLFAARTQCKADVRARRVQELVQRLGDRDVVAPHVQPPQQTEGRGDGPKSIQDWRCGGGELGRHSKRMKDMTPESVSCRPAEGGGPLQQLLVADRKERSAQRREDRQLIVGPLDGSKRGANRLDLFTLVKRAAADETCGSPRDSRRRRKRASRPSDN